MPYYRWDEMTRRQLASPSDSEGSMIVGQHVTLTRTSHTIVERHVDTLPTGQENRAARCGTSGKRFDAACRQSVLALRVAPGRPPAASSGSIVVPLRSSPLSWRIDSARRDDARDSARGPG